MSLAVARVGSLQVGAVPAARSARAARRTASRCTPRRNVVRMCGLIAVHDKDIAIPLVSFLVHVFINMLRFMPLGDIVAGKRWEHV